MAFKPISITPREPTIYVASPYSSLSLSSTSHQPIKFPSPRNQSSPIPIDSAYATQNHSTLGSLERLAKSNLSTAIEEQRRRQDAARQVARGTPIPGYDDLLSFQIDPSELVIARSKEIMPEVQRLLQKHALSQDTDGNGNNSNNSNSSVRRKRQRCMMTTRLMMVGKTVSDARPAIVISAGGGKDMAREIENLLMKQVMKDLYFPHDNISAEKFDVVIVGEPPRTRTSVSFLLDREGGGRFADKLLATYAGVRIRLEIDETKSAIATFGGLVKLTKMNGDIQLVGMTAGHMLEELLDDGGDEDDANDDTMQDASHVDDTLHRYGDQLPKPALGQLIYPEETGGDFNIPARDWALFNIHHQVKVKPNLVQRSGLAHDWGRTRTNDDELTVAPPGAFPEIDSTEVILLTRADTPHGVKFGVLSHLPGGLMLNPEKGFVEAYLLHLDEGVQVEDGDSGAWVVDPVSKAVYGHMVATDYTGAAYVLPLHATFDEIKTELGIQSIELPTTADLLEIALCATASTSSVEEAPISTPVDITEQRPWRQQGGITNIWSARDCSRDQHMSELFSASGYKRISVFSDKDSGYGSCGGTPMGRMEFGYQGKEADDEDEYSAW